MIYCVAIFVVLVLGIIAIEAVDKLFPNSADKNDRRFVEYALIGLAGAFCFGIVW